MMKILFRDAEPRDAAAVQDLFQSGLVSGGTSVVPPLEYIHLSIMSNDDVMRVAETEVDGVVGVCLLEKSKKPFPSDSFYLSTIVVDYVFRGRGLGNMLLCDMIAIVNKLALRHSKKRLFAYTYFTPSGLISRKMALKNGFRPANRQRPDECYTTSKYGKLGGETTDDATLVLDLPYTPPPQSVEAPPALPVQPGLVGLFKKLFF